MSSSSPKVSRDVLMQGIAEGITKFENEFPLEDFSKGDYKQYPVITLLTCSDSRMPVNVFGSIFNRIFSVENIGNQFRSSEGSVLYGLLHLRTPLMIVAGHTDCGAINAAESNFVSEPLGIRNELSIVKDSLDGARRLYSVSNDDSDLKYTLLSEVNVDMQINYLLANPEVSELVKNDELLLLGVMVDLHNHYDEGYGRTYTINVNGERDIGKLKERKVLGLMAERAKRLTR
ncbi:MAG TPA: carbonic anhydrase [Gelria sp.]|nr:carbonic anhydrase [Gelria sp.]